MTHRMTLAGLIWACFIQIGSTQDIHIFYDAFRDSMYFQQNGKTVSAPSVRDGQKVFLHVENYNNYLYELALEVENTEVALASVNPAGGLNGLVAGNMLKNPLDLLFQGGGDQLLGAFKMFPGLSGKDLKDGGSGWGTSPEETQRKEQVAQLKKVEIAFEQVRDRVFELDESIKNLETQTQAKLASNRLQTFAASEIAHLRYNPHLEPQQIKTLTREYMTRIFQESDPANISLEQVLKIADAQNEIPRFLDQYKQKVEYHKFLVENPNRLTRIKDDL